MIALLVICIQRLFWGWTCEI